jgi:hypothetical protein
LNEGVVAAAILAAVSPGFQPGGLDVETMEVGSFLRSWRQDAAGYGRQDARRYGKADADERRSIHIRELNFS